MLIEFKVSNFRSIKDEQVLSMVASNHDKKKSGNLIGPELPGLLKTKILKGVAIYGANASGKSNLLDAFRFMAYFVRNSVIGIAPDDPTGTVVFALDQETQLRPSTFEVTFILNRVRYTYGFSVGKERVYREYLIAFPRGKAQEWFTRKYDFENKRELWHSRSSFFKLDRNICDKTRKNSLFLSTGAQFNQTELTLVYEWFKNRIHFLNLDGESQYPPVFTAALFDQNPKLKDRGIQLLKSADVGISGIQIDLEEIESGRFREKIRDHIPPSLFRKMESDPKLASLKMTSIRFLHLASNLKDQSFDFEDESAGTRRFFSLLGPWLDILENGYTVLIDELETSLHPLLIKEFLKLLFDERYNDKGAQVIFTTHNPLLLDTEIFRRDQVWFTEKDNSGATQLYPLTDFKPRNSESLMRGYLAGRYGAIPFIPQGLKLT